MDYIEIKGLEVFAYHGLLEEEKKNGQMFFFDISFGMSTWETAISGDLSKGVDYAAACHKIKAFEEEHPVELIETAAEQLARYLLHEYETVVREVTVQIRKPFAPIGLKNETPLVRITRGWHDAYIGLGSNMGERAALLAGGVDFLRRHPDITVLEEATTIETEPYGYTDQDRFLNSCVHIRTICEPMELLDVLMAGEREANRERLIHWGPRTLDMDMLFYDEVICGTGRLILPHPEIEKRMFVLEPLCEIAPFLRHPVSKKTVKQLKEELQEKSGQ